MPSRGGCANIINKRSRKDLFGTADNPENFLHQDGKALRRYCLRRRLRFVDELFPPDRRSIGQVEKVDVSQIVWKRPAEICQPRRPSFISKGVSRFDFGQGSLGNCWFLASIGALTFQKDIYERVVPLDQSFDEGYCGLFHFRFWRFGGWVNVVIDDKLPTIDGRLVFVRSTNPTEFWPALLEKAYAKVCGSYGDMSAGSPVEALVDFTGGIHICAQLSKPPTDLWDMMCRAGQSKALMGCGTPAGETSANDVLPNGLVQGHAYTISGVIELIVVGVDGVAYKVKLVRVFNPWGYTEWKGDWSDESPLWHSVSPEDRARCLSVANDGEFWISLEDFSKSYTDVDICCECPEFLDGGSSCHWKTSVYHGRWVAGTTAGGCKESVWTNPQYRVKIGELSKECSTTQGDKNMLVSLMQKPDKRNRHLVQNLHIGFHVYEVTKEYQGRKGRLPASFFDKYRSVARTQKFMNAREVMDMMWLKPGEYLIVPSTYEPNETASFILTIVSKAETHVHEDSGGHNHELVERGEVTPFASEASEERKPVIRQLSEEYDAVSAELLQEILNDKLLKVETGGFSIDACRSMVALFDTYLAGELSGDEIALLWEKANIYKEVFESADVSETGALSVIEAQEAFMATGMEISDDIFEVMILRYSADGEVTLVDFISLAIRFDCMSDTFDQMEDGMTMNLDKSEWMFLSMYN